MISAVAQTLGRILAKETSLASSEAISFNFPRTNQPIASELILYFYDIRAISGLILPLTQPNIKNSVATVAKLHLSSNQTQLKKIKWFEVLFLLSASDHTNLGSQQLLSEALTVLLRHELLSEQLLAPILQGYGDLPLVVHRQQNLVGLWQALAVPFRPALYFKVIAPLKLSTAEIKTSCKLAS